MNETHRGYFNSLATEWNSLMPDVPLLGEYLVRFGVSAGERILDIGTGTGRTAAMLSERVGSDGRVFAVDLAERMLVEAQKTIRASNVHFLCADAGFIPIRDQAVDRVLIFSAFPHFPEPRLAVREMFRVLKKGGGLLVLHACSSKALNQFHASLDGVVSRDVLPKANELLRLMRDCGFEKKQVLENEELYWVEVSKASSSETNYQIARKNDGYI